MSNRKPASPPPTDTYEVLLDGRLKLTIDGEDFYLNAPKIGLQRKLDESIATIAAAEKDFALWQLDQFGGSIEEAQQLVDGKMSPERAQRLVETANRVDPADAMKRRQEVDDLRVAWWTDGVFPTLCPQLAEIDPDDLPGFLVSQKVINEARAGWAGNPPVPGAG